MIPLNRILLVDDDVVTNMIHTRVIGKSGCALAIDVACDGQQALDMLRADLAANSLLPELVLLDVNMPYMGGFAFLEKYADLNISTNVQRVVLTLSTPLLRMDRARALADKSVYSLCEKPLRPDVLVKLAQGFFEQKDEVKPVGAVPRKHLQSIGAGPHQDRLSLQASQDPPDWSRHVR